MKALTKFLAILVLLCALVMGYCALGMRLQVRILSETVSPASAEPDLFNQILVEYRAGAFGSNVYKSIPEDADIADYAFIRIALRAGSYGPLPCEWIHAGVTPLSGDVILCRDAVPDIGPLGRAEAELLILAEAPASSDISASSAPSAATHGVYLEYYALGIRTYADAVR